MRKEVEKEMRKASVLMLGILAISLFASVSIVQITRAEPNQKPERFYLITTLELTSWGLIPIEVELSLSWVPYLGPPVSVDLEEIWIDGHLCCIATIVENVLNPYDGTFVHNLVILWVEEFGPGDKTTCTFFFTDGTGCFEGILAHGKAWVDFTTETGPIDDGPILIQHEVGTILWTGP